MMLIVEDKRGDLLFHPQGQPEFPHHAALKSPSFLSLHSINHCQVRVKQLILTQALTLTTYFLTWEDITLIEPGKLGIWYQLLATSAKKAISSRRTEQDQLILTHAPTIEFALLDCIQVICWVLLTSSCLNSSLDQGLGGMQCWLPEGCIEKSEYFWFICIIVLFLMWCPEMK